MRTCPSLRKISQAKLTLYPLTMSQLSRKHSAIVGRYRTRRTFKSMMKCCPELPTGFSQWLKRNRAIAIGLIGTRHGRQ